MPGRKAPGVRGSAIRPRQQAVEVTLEGQHGKAFALVQVFYQARFGPKRRAIPVVLLAQPNDPGLAHGRQIGVVVGSGIARGNWHRIRRHVGADVLPEGRGTQQKSGSHTKEFHR